MSNLLVGLVFQLDLEPSKKLVLMSLADSADDSGGSCWPAVSTVARKASISLRQAQRQLRSLENDDLCRVESHANGGRNTRRYRLNVGKIREMIDEGMRGDKLSPLKRSPRTLAKQCQTVTPAVTHSVTAGVTSASPELPADLSGQDTTTTAAGELYWPTRAFAAEQVVVAKDRLQRFGPQLQQQLLDEYQGVMEGKKPPASPMGWFLGLVAKAARGEFVPNLGVLVAGRRAQRAAESAEQEAAKVAADERRRRALDPMARKRVASAIDEANALLGIRSRTP
jgi:hypothetical protein